MPLFNYNPSDSIDYTVLTKELEKKSKPTSKSRGLARPRAMEWDLSKQFLIFQIQPPGGESAAIELSKVSPQFEGGPDAPDMLMQLEMICFNLSNQEKVNSKTRGTMRVIVEQLDSGDAKLKPLVWVVSAGLQLYNLTEKRRALPSELKMDFKNTFGQRPIEIPKGRASLTFDVYKHREPKWWNRVFNFVTSKTGKTLTSSIGFPGVTQEAVGIINDLLNRLGRSKTETLFKSKALKLALSNSAKELGSAGAGDFIKVGVLNPGLFVLCQGKDYKFFKNTPATYYEEYGTLVPQETAMEDIFESGYQNPFADKTFAIFKVGMQPTRLQPQMIFGVEMPHAS